jgi:hypothetical protein
MELIFSLFICWLLNESIQIGNFQNDNITRLKEHHAGVLKNRRQKHSRARVIYNELKIVLIILILNAEAICPFMVRKLVLIYQVHFLHNVL